MNKKTVTLISLVVSIIVCSVERYAGVHDRIAAAAQASTTSSR